MCYAGYMTLTKEDLIEMRDSQPWTREMIETLNVAIEAKEYEGTLESMAMAIYFREAK